LPERALFSSQVPDVEALRRSISTPPGRLRNVDRARAAAREMRDVLHAVADRARVRLRTHWAGVTLVDADHAQLVCQTGRFSISEEMPLADSFCTYVAAFDEPLALSETLRSPPFSGSSLVRAMGVSAYLGVPVRTCSGATLGTLSVMERTVRQWSQNDVDQLQRMARSIEASIHPAMERVVRSERQRFLARIRSDRLRELCEDWQALCPWDDLPDYHPGVQNVLMDDDDGVLAEVLDAQPFRCRITHLGRTLDMALNAPGSVPDALRQSISAGMEPFYRQCFSSASAVYARLSMRLQGQRIGFERLLLPFRRAPAPYPTHLMGCVALEGISTHEAS